MFVRINNPDDRAIGRRLFALERKTGFLSPAPENQLADTGAGGVDGHQRLALRGEILIERLDNEQLATLERRVFDCRYDGPDNAGELHFGLWALDL